MPMPSRRSIRLSLVDKIVLGVLVAIELAWLYLIGWALSFL
jgi:hypothetical protein